MTGRDDAKTAVLGRIREALAAAPPAPVVIPRHYDRQCLSGAGNVERFVETVSEYQAQVLRVDAASVAATVASLIPPAGRVIVPSDLPSEWVTGIDTLTDDPADPLPSNDLEQADAVVTACALAIAATGTIVLDSRANQGRRALTLVPDHHICIVSADQVVNTVSQAFAVLTPSAPLTFISGPSATSDIELDRVEGVHGPRTLDVLIIETRGA
ncbi:MAG TPA: LUD domain-containing protein [Mycobacterium sp.]|jgi:L-lactate dehydrogenase complex protein LldG|nr:LUD domain-containing protein [Mycobacterium sp.]